MEVGDEGVDALERITGIDEDVGIAGTGGQGAVGGGGAFQGAHGGGADADDPAAVFAGGVDDLGAFAADLVIFAVHFVLGSVLFLDGAEGAQADVKQDGRYLDAHGAHFFEQFGGEMQSRGRSGGGAVDMRVNGVIAAAVLQFFRDIRGKRHAPRLVEYLFEDAVERKFELSHAFFAHARHDRAQTGRKPDLGAFKQLSSRADDSFPALVRKAF